MGVLLSNGQMSDHLLFRNVVVSIEHEKLSVPLRWDCSHVADHVRGLAILGLIYKGRADCQQSGFRYGFAAARFVPAGRVLDADVLSGHSFPP
jgi:hypothetical protein